MQHFIFGTSFFTYFYTGPLILQVGIPFLA
jgi:hypothetical protein